VVLPDDLIHHPAQGCVAQLVEQFASTGGEIQLTDAIASLLESEPVDAFRFHGQRFDCGNKLGFLEATLRLALEREDLGGPLRAILRTL
jgi:UTP--glucose-1-phosphate uridylyltransferase